MREADSVSHYEHRKPNFQYPLDGVGIKPPWFDENGAFVPKLYVDDSSHGHLYHPRGTFYEIKTNPGVEQENPFDLETLETLEKNFRETGNPAICIIATGGTIASRETEGSLVPREDIESLFAYAGRFLPQRYSYSAFQFPTLINSSQMRTDYLSELVIAMSWMHAKMSPDVKHQFRGFLVTHGTDTMAPSATRLAMMLGPNLEFSVGVTGSQAGMDDDDNEIPANMNGSINALNRLFDADRKTVFLYMGANLGGGYNPSGAIKISDTDILAFDSPAFSKIYDPSKVGRGGSLNVSFANKYFTNRHSQKDFFSPTILRGPVTSRILNADMDIPPAELAEIIRSYDYSVNGLILRTYGSFTFEQTQLDAILDAAQKRQVDVYASNPFPTGRVDHRDSDAMYLLDRGVMPLYMMPHAAQVKLMLAQQIFGNDREAVRDFMTNNNYVGEQPDVWEPGLNHDVPNMMRNIGQPRETLPKQRLPIYP